MNFMMTKDLLLVMTNVQPLGQSHLLSLMFSCKFTLESIDLVIANPPLITTNLSHSRLFKCD